MSAHAPFGRACALGLACGLALVLAAPANATTRPATPATLAAILGAAAAGDTVALARGVYAGPLTVARALVLRGGPGVVLDGGGKGTVLTITAAGATVCDVEIRGSGPRVLTIDAGILVENAPDVTLARITTHDVLYGIYAERSDRLAVLDGDLAGRVAPLDDAGEGNGIHLWYCGGARLVGDRLRGFTDAIYLSFARDVTVERCVLSGNGRYGLHTMYCQATRLTRSVFERNQAGCAIMFSNHMEVRDNAFRHNRGPRTYGLLLRDCSDGAFADNQVVDNTIGLFLDDSNRNAWSGNLVADNGWGVLLFSSCAGNVFAGNAFVNNDYPVALDMRYSDNRFDDGKRGNYWSEGAAYDLDGDGLGDVPYSPVSTFAFLSKQYPDLTVLAKSPAVAALDVAERVFPALRPSEIVDHHPLLAPPRLARPRGGAPAPAERRASGSPLAALAFGGLLASACAGIVLGRAA